MKLWPMLWRQTTKCWRSSNSFRLQLTYIQARNWSAYY